MNDTDPRQTKGIATPILLVVVLVILAAAGVAVTVGIFSPRGGTNQKRVENWVTFQRKDLNFSIQYPPEWGSVVRTDGSVAFAPKGRLGEFPEVTVSQLSRTATSFDIQKKLLEEMELTDKRIQQSVKNGQDRFFVEGTASKVLADGEPWHIQRLIIDDQDRILLLAGNNAEETFMNMVETLGLED